MRTNIINAHSVYTFSDYFKLSNYTEELLMYFGYSWHRAEYNLPRSTMSLDRIEDFITRFKEPLPYLSLTNETVRREFLIAPILVELIHYTQVKPKIEWPLIVNEQLKGTLDYYLESANNLLIIEAKNADLESGFTQLAIELIALAEWTEHTVPLLYGVVSTGNIWQFGILECVQKQITQDLNLFRAPADLEDLLRVMVAIIGK